MKRSAPKTKQRPAAAKTRRNKPPAERGEMVDQEGCYRRGFEHGAFLTFECAKHLFGSEAGRERLRQWVEVELRQWRLAARERRVPDPPMPGTR
jgi:hypothetical protein